MLRKFLLPLVLLACVAAARPSPSFAQIADGTAVAGLPERIVRPMRAVDPITLKAEGQSIRLWGIKPAQTAETPLELQALDKLDKLIQEGQVDCKIMQGSTLTDIVARCLSSTHQDLAISLLASGLVVVDRRQTYNSIFATDYEKAQETARLNSEGVWKFVTETKDSNGLPSWLQPYMSIILPLALIFGPFGGLFLVAIVMWYWLKRMANAQEQEAEQSSRKEAQLLTRERQVLVATLEGELFENKNKIEAFVAIYGEMLKSLKDSNETPRYQSGGDIVQKHPTFSKTLFEANVNRLSLLDIKVAGRISKLYASMPKEAEYINLEPDLPLDAAVQIVEKVLKDAEAMVEPIDTVLKGLQSALQSKSQAKAPPVAAAEAA